MSEFKIISSSAATSYSGSINKILSLGNADSLGTNAVSGSVLSSIKFGNYPEDTGGAPFTPVSNITGPITIPAGTYLEGPIGEVKVDSGGVLIYINN